MQHVVEAKAKRWGNSLGIIIPKDIVEKERIKANDTVKVLVLHDSTELFKRTFGILKGKFKKSSQQMKDEMRAELYND